MHTWHLAAALRSGTSMTATSLSGTTRHDASPDDAMEWSWPPYAPLAVGGEPFDTTEWAPSSVVWHPQLRLGRWTVVYRRTEY
ncbi:hypothetical protein O2W18_16265 [Modestobacter sp. VKM Ac-2983]|uniref:hypothetical protein n=1 Tax=Modestobacter sp. VKM Ac-2983 TaxID=3004137 RepID=UPI0022AB936A|nr:hypothetical protein [Modestobacter sp. VKM Ac-2983]MCZ2806664.1 hypothetical protein [Modestobacter sp. VKM Ac-2983]